MGALFYEQGTRTMFAGRTYDKPFPTHLHDPVEIVYVIKGRLKMTVDGCTQVLRSGDAAVCFPVVPHSYDVVSEDAVALTLIFTPETMQEFTPLFRRKRPVDPFLLTAGKNDELDGIALKLLELEKEESSVMRKAYMHVFLAHLLEMLPLESASHNAGESGLPYQVLHYISEHFTEPISLESTASALGVSRIHLSHIFSQKLNINFRHYINTLRVDMACRLLRESQYSISQIIGMCGYDNPRTFHRAFQTQWNMTPTEFRTRYFSSGQPPEVKAKNENA